MKHIFNPKSVSETPKLKEQVSAELAKEESIEDDTKVEASIIKEEPIHEEVEPEQEVELDEEPEDGDE